MGKVHQNSSTNDEPVLTPLGWRPKSKVHIVQHGFHVSGAGNRLRKIDSSTGKVVRKFTTISSDITALSDFNVAGEDLLRIPVSGGWIVNSAWLNEKEYPISYFSSKWRVPKAPLTDNDQIIYLFNGLQQTANGPFILQPVLQWRPSEVAGSPSWYIANWYVGPHQKKIYKSEDIQVKEGDILQGVIRLTAQSGSKCSYLCSFAGYPVIDLPVADIQELKWACEALECYRFMEFSDYPDTQLTSFYDIDIRVRTGGADSNIPLKWDPKEPIKDNGQKCVIISDANPGGQTDLYYRS
jgi:hypothetical protein